MLRTHTALILTFVATAALAQAPSPRLADLKEFSGNWTCKGIAFASPWGPEHPTTAKIQVQWILGGYWLNAQYAETKTPQNPKPAAGRVHWGWDEQKKTFTGYAVNNFGGHVTIDSSGWQGDTIVWNGMMSIGGTTFATRDTFIRTKAGQIRHMTEAQQNNQWNKLNEETCRKTKAK